MDKQEEILSGLDKLNETVSRIDGTTTHILKSMPKEENKAITALNIAAAAVGVTSVVSIIQQIIDWLK
jgi:hypothetical protein